MNIESALRKRAILYRVCAAAGWLLLLGMGFFYLKTEVYSLRELTQHEEYRDAWKGAFNPNLLVIVLPGFLLLSALAYVLGKVCLFLLIQADRYTTLADALCLSGTSMQELENAIKITTQNSGTFSISDISNGKDARALVELIRSVK